MAGPKQQSSEEKRMMRNLLRRNLVLGDAAAARRLRSVRLNRPTIMKKMRPSPRKLARQRLYGCLPPFTTITGRGAVVPPAQPQPP